jgi:aminoglycoside phosphotransferase (APT) family kinase protein
LEDAAVLLPGDEEGLTESEIDQLRGAAPRLKAMCAELAGYRVPQALEHGDFHAGQVLAGDGRFVYLDWSDSSVAHPFFSMFLFFAYARMEECLAAHSDVRARLRDAYLEPWTVYEPMKRLREAFEISQRLAALHIAAIYQQAILPNLEDRNEWQAMAPWCLKLLLQQL